MNINKFLKAVPPFANKIKKTIKNMDPYQRSFVFLGTLFALIGIFFDAGLFFIGVLLVGGAAINYFFSRNDPKQVKAYIKSLDLSTKLKDARSRIQRFFQNTDMIGTGSLIIAISSVVAILSFSAYLVSSGDDERKNTVLYQIEQCMKEQDSILLENKFSLKAACGTKFQKDLPNRTLTGFADFDPAGTITTFSGNVETTDAFIVTEFSIKVEYDGKKEIQYFRNLWVEQNSKYPFTFRRMKIGPSLETVDTKDFSWSIRNIKGIPILE